METWFAATVMATVLSGFSNHLFKVAAQRGYDSETFQIYGGLFSSVYLFPIAIVFSTFAINPLALLISFGAGVVAAGGGVGKVYALRYIDTTIYFPLFKLLSPLIAIVLGLVLFTESHSWIEWTGLLLGIAVPLLLITKSENGRQTNLYLGLVLVLVTGIISAGVAAANNIAVDIAPRVLPNLAAAGFGVMAGGLVITMYRKGISKTYRHVLRESSRGLMLWSAVRSVMVSASLGLVLYAYTTGGGLGIVHTILSLYILIPIILSILFFKEHWNLQKAAAIIMSVVALALLG